VSDEVFEVNLDSLKIREIEEIEEAAGVPLGQLLAGDKPMGKGLRVIGWVVKKRTIPDFTLEQAGELVIKLDSSEPDPTSAAGS
jgi:hypothetical protein